MTPAEYIAQRTWSILGRAKALRARFGEESLTDLLVLDMLPHQHARGFWLRPTTKRQEASSGADLLVAVRHRSKRWSVFVLQAKKLYSNGKYGTLNGGRKCVDQLNKLERCARQLHALPLYLLYNHTNSPQLSKYWRCPLPFIAEQLGCTLVPSWHIRQLISRKSPRTFDQAHRAVQAMLWRCAFDCPFSDKLLWQSGFRPSDVDRDESSDAHDIGAPAYDWSFEPRTAVWPERLFDRSTTELTFDDFDEIRRELSDTGDFPNLGTPQQSTGREEGPLYPARLLIVDNLAESAACFREEQGP